jgi:hypothetical protein
MALSEFNWIPSGSIDVGNLDSENDSNYRSTGEIVNARLLYADGTVSTSKLGRRTTEEIFTVNISRPRWGPVLNSLVIRRRINTLTEPVELTIKIDGEEQGKWLRPRFEGTRRFAEVLFVVPLEIMMKDPSNPKTLKRQITMAISADQPYESYQYDFFVTRDWNLMPKGYLGPIISRDDESAESLYINGLVKEGDHSWTEAMELYGRAAEKCGDFELERCIRRRARRCRYFLAAAKVKDTREEKHFDEHYALGQYCVANGFWNEALAEYTKAVEANATHADATYNLAEAMEYCRMPVEKFAPLMERAGSLYNRTDTNEISVLCAINTYEIWTRPTGRAKRQLSSASMDGLYRDWRYVEQMVYGASRGAWRLNTTYRLFTEDDPPWVVHHGWMWGPPASDIPKRGMYDHMMCFAEYNSSHACGVDCGPAWSGCTQIGPRRGWEVMLHEWNHQFHWMCMSSEEGRGYPATHDCSSCGKQPIVSMGCGHRSSMRYYLNPAQYRRLEPSDPDVPQTHIRTWAVFGPLDGPALAGTTAEEILTELKTRGFATDKEVELIKSRAEAGNEDLAQAARTWFYNSGRMDLVKAIDEESTLSPATHDKKQWRIINDKDGGRINLNTMFPDAPLKSFAYAHTYIWSPEEQEVRAWYGYHGGLRVWHNRRTVRNGRWYTVNYFRQDPEWVDMLCGHLVLKKGWNSLLCKIERCAPATEDPWGFSVNLVNYDNAPVQGLKYQAEVPDGPVNAHEPLEVGRYYNWEDVKDDYLELLPELSEDDFRKITGIPELTLAENIFLMAVPKNAVHSGTNVITLEDLTEGIGDATIEGEKTTVSNFFNEPIPRAPEEQRALPFNKFRIELCEDVTLNNFLNFDREWAGALRYLENGKPRDLLFIRPDYLEEYLALIDDSESGMPGSIGDRILGYWFIDPVAYPSTPNRKWRAIVVTKTYLGKSYPIDEQDILGIPVSRTEKQPANRDLRSEQTHAIVRPR